MPETILLPKGIYVGPNIKPEYPNGERVLVRTGATCFIMERNEYQVRLGFELISGIATKWVNPRYFLPKVSSDLKRTVNQPVNQPRAQAKSQPIKQGSELVIEPPFDWQAARVTLHGAVHHLAELSDAWERGVLREYDHSGGARSNRNISVMVDLVNLLSRVNKKC